MIFVDVDTQHDFCDPDGALFVSGAPTAHFSTLTQLGTDRGIPILGSVDSHAFDAWEFKSSNTVGPKGEDPQFPDHCIKGTPGWLKVAGTTPRRSRFVPNVPGQDGAALGQELHRGDVDALYFEKEVYSLFANPVAGEVVSRLAALEPEPQFVVYGVATDYCVKAAGLGLRQRGHAVTVLIDAIAGVTQRGADASLEQLRTAGVTLAPMAQLA